MSTASMMLTDTQLVILTAAAGREDGHLLPVPISVKARGGALRATLQSLLAKGYAEESVAAREDEAWREDDEQVRFGLTITPSGLAALGMGDETHSPVTPQETAGTDVANPLPPTADPRRGSKQERLSALLASEDGASIETLMQDLGWLAHTVRAAISGLRKRGIAVETTRANGVTVYRIPQPASSTAEALR